METFKIKYFLISILLLVVEILIALFANDNFIRPIFGDYLAVIFLIYLFAAFLNFSKINLAIATLLIAYILEGLQYIQFLKLLGLEKCKILNIVVGNSFSWTDLLAYTLGFVTVLLIHSSNKK